MNNRTASRATYYKLEEDSTSLLANVDPENAYDGIGVWHDPSYDGDSDDGKHCNSGSVDAANSHGLITVVADAMPKADFNA